MHYGRRRHKFSRDLRRSKLSPLRYSRYARSGGYSRFYSDEETPNETEKAFDVLAESLEDIEQAIEEAEKEAEKRGETDELEKLEEEIEKEIEAALKGKTNYSRLFSDLARGRLYNTSANKLGEYRSLAVKTAVKSLNNVITAYEKGKISEEDAEKSGLIKVLERIFGWAKWLLNFLAKLIVSFLAYLVPRVVIASAIIVGLSVIMFFILSVSLVTINIRVFISFIYLFGFFLGLAGLYFIYATTKSVIGSIEVATTESETIMSTIHDVLTNFNNLSSKIQSEVGDFRYALDQAAKISPLIEEFKDKSFDKIEEIIESLSEDVPEEERKEIEKKIEKEKEQIKEAIEKTEQKEEEIEEQTTQSKLGRYSSRRGAPSLMRHKRYSERGRRRGFYSDWD